MAKQQETRTIGDNEYTATQLDAVKGREGLLRLMRSVAPAMAEAAALQEAGELVALTSGFAKLLDKLTPEDLTYFCDIFGASCTLRIPDEKGDRTPTVKAVFVEHFAGQYLEMFEWLAFCFELNYASFFTSAFAKMPAVLGVANAAGRSTNKK